MRTAIKVRASFGVADDVFVFDCQHALAKAPDAALLQHAAAAEAGIELLRLDLGESSHRAFQGEEVAALAEVPGLEYRLPRGAGNALQPLLALGGPHLLPARERRWAGRRATLRRSRRSRPPAIATMSFSTPAAVTSAPAPGPVITRGLLE